MTRILTVIGLTLLLLTACENIAEIQKPYDLGADPINASQFGFITEEEQSLYYLDGTKSSNIVSSNGDTIMQVYENTYGRGIQLQGDYIFYSTYGEEPGIFKVHKNNPNDREKIVDVYVSGYIIVSDYILYSTNEAEQSGIYRVKWNGEEHVQLVEGMINHMQWHDGSIYYAIPEEGRVIKMTSAGKEQTELKTERDVHISATNFMIIDKYIYFKNRDTSFPITHPPRKPSHNIYRMKLDGTNVNSLANGSLKNSDGSSIFYTTSRTQLSKMDLDGSNPTVIYEGEEEWYWVNQINGEIYLLDWNTEGISKVYYYDSANSELKEIGN